MFSQLTGNQRKGLRMPPWMNDHTEPLPIWLSEVFSFLDTHVNEFRIGVYGMAKKTLRQVEADWAPVPTTIAVGRNGTFIIRWAYGSETVYAIEFLSVMEYRHRLRMADGYDSGMIMVNSNYADPIREVFDDAFRVHRATKHDMFRTVGARFK
jgi:hypothetical protein